MKRFYFLLGSFFVVCFSVVCCSTKKVVYYEKIIKHQETEGGAEIYDKVIVYKLSSKKDSICYYKDGKFVGATTTIITKTK
ncbi:MAG: hypothetical protein HN704_04915 [Bacteroidetes bacterium]|mgnify:FL=1|jgi:hypothetical protein|nr:hypothetical protein [Bacteroidota bacterium]MBT7143546.1 hypothetical protein [Bacteroidota bacterium]MBT7490933.1 hypothetical protein [Bacteroidota bacterium]